MDQREVMERVSALLDAHGTGLLATTDADGAPHVRWLTPAVLPQQAERSTPSPARRSPRSRRRRAPRGVEWMFQTPTLTEIITVRGT